MPCRGSERALQRSQILTLHTQAEPAPKLSARAIARSRSKVDWVVPRPRSLPATSSWIMRDQVSDEDPPLIAKATNTDPAAFW